jgi:hypothetical protein
MKAKNEVTKSAVEITPEDLRTVCRHLGATDATVAVIAFKTASRWGDLRRALLIRMNSTEILVLFDTTKSEKRTTRKGKREDHQVLATFAVPLPVFIRKTLPRGQPTTLSYLPTATFRRRMKANGLPFSGHSFKQGAVEQLLAAAEEGKVNLARIPLLMKHAEAQTVLLKRVGMSYANTPEKRLRIARLCETHVTTLAIPLPPHLCCADGE